MVRKYQLKKQKLSTDNQKRKIDCSIIKTFKITIPNATFTDCALDRIKKCVPLFFQRQKKVNVHSYKKLKSHKLYYLETEQGRQMCDSK